MSLFIYTFADEFPIQVEGPALFGTFVINGLVFLKVVEAQVFRQFGQLLFIQRFAKEFCYLFNFPTQILEWQRILYVTVFVHYSIE